PFTTQDVYKRGDASDTAVRGWLTELMHVGFVNLLDSGKGRPHKWELADESQRPDLETATVLPSVVDVCGDTASWLLRASGNIMPDHDLTPKEVRATSHPAGSEDVRGLEHFVVNALTDNDLTHLEVTKWESGKAGATSSLTPATDEDLALEIVEREARLE